METIAFTQPMQSSHGDLVYCAIKPWKLNLPPPIDKSGEI